MLFKHKSANEFKKEFISTSVVYCEILYGG